MLSIRRFLINIKNRHTLEPSLLHFFYNDTRKQKFHGMCLSQHDTTNTSASGVVSFILTSLVSTSLVSTLQLRRQKTKTTIRYASTGSDSKKSNNASGTYIDPTRSTTTTSKQEVQKKRLQHFMKCVSISYANSGGLMMMQGIGSRLMDETGRSYLDTRNNVCHVGHCHPKVVEAVSRQLATLNTNTRYLHPNVCELAERLCAKCPKPLEVVVFVNSGSVRSTIMV